MNTNTSTEYSNEHIGGFKETEKLQSIGNLPLRKEKSKFRNILSKFMNFVCAMIIFSIVLFAIGAFLSADLHSKDMLGNYDSQIFSFNKTSEATAEIIAFGEKFIVDFNKVYEIRSILISLSRLNSEYTPSIILLSAEIVENCAESVIKNVGKIPSIAGYFYAQTYTQTTEN